MLTRAFKLNKINLLIIKMKMGHRLKQKLIKSMRNFFLKKIHKYKETQSSEDADYLED